jgi:hypothetical protein
MTKHGPNLCQTVHIELRNTELKARRGIFSVPSFFVLVVGSVGLAKIAMILLLRRPSVQQLLRTVRGHTQLRWRHSPLKPCFISWAESSKQ